MKFIIPFFFFLSLFFHKQIAAQKIDNDAVKVLLEKYKTDDRGPYKDIRWFCNDGTINMPKEPCDEKIKGVQRARYKDEVESLAKSQHIFLGQILSTTSRTDFWDADNYHSRLKQYQLEKYLRAVDNGWVLRKGQFYRGAIQVEDEEAWGINFFDLILSSDSKINQNFYLIRQAAKDIPHAGDNNYTQNIRALSKVIAESYPAFSDLRVKIHGQPDATDIAASIAFKEANKEKLSIQNLRDFEQMINDMQIIYRPIQLETLNKYTQQLPKNSDIYKSLNDYIYAFKNNDFSVEKVKATAEKIFEIRKGIIGVERSKARLALLDISIALENILFQNVSKWQTSTLQQLMEKSYFLGKASAGCGYLEMWEWEEIEARIPLPKTDEINLTTLVNWHEEARRLVEWGTGTVRGTYKNVVDLYSGFEPLAYGFFDDKIRSSILLPLGDAVSDLGNAVAKEAKFSNQILDISNPSSFRGLNPGFALGELVVVTGSPDEVEVSKDKIYIFHSPASDLKPVAGIATVTEGNMVSHVQLLARNLGIPNAVLSEQNLQSLKKYSGEKVFFAVSNQGTVLMKLEKDMSDEERKLFDVKKRNEEKIAVPIDKIELDNTAVLNLRDVKSKDSGKTCGPKAANLGQLKAMFPNNVVEGIVIPFSIFRQHMEQSMPDYNGSFWEFLNNAFARADEINDEAEAEKFMLRELETFRAAIKQIPLSNDFTTDLKESFANALGNKMGTVPVFLRSDTNMEDLKDFTGAGLNLTLFNVLEEDKILQGIRDVWASPYTERSYKWRQKYLLNPENVYPSILIIPSVDVDYSGVLITKGITSGNSDDMTIAFSRGAGGAVDGQSAESYLLKANGENILLSPAREPFYRRLPTTGGTANVSATFHDPILNKNNLADIRTLTNDVNRVLPTTPGVESTGPFDIELGFQDDKMWLFQIRPFVENKNAKGSAFLASITPELPKEQAVAIQEKIKINPKRNSKEVIPTKINEEVKENANEENMADHPEENYLSYLILFGLLSVIVFGLFAFFQKK